MLAGVVVQQWLESSAADRRGAFSRRLDDLRDEQERILAQLDAIGMRRVSPPPSYRRRVDAIAFRCRSRQYYLEVAARPLRSRLGAIRAAEADIAAAVASGGVEKAIKALVAACEQGEPQGLGERAESTVRAAHAAWEAIARAATKEEADRWAEGA